MSARSVLPASNHSSFVRTHWDNLDSFPQRKTQSVACTGSRSKMADHAFSLQGNTWPVNAPRRARHRGPKAAKGRASEAASSAGGRTVFHKVESGETLWSIARMYGIPVPDLMAYNGISDVREVYSESVVIIPLLAPASPRTIQGDPSRSSASSSSLRSGTDPNEASGVGRGSSGQTQVATEEASTVLRGLASRVQKTSNSFHLTDSLKVLLFCYSAALISFLIVAVRELMRTFKEARDLQWVQEPEPERPNVALKTRTSMSLVLDRLSRSQEWSREEMMADGVSAGADLQQLDAATATAQLDIDQAPEPSPEEVAQDYEEIRRRYREGLEASYRTFLKDTGSQTAGRFRGGMPSKFRNKKPPR
ncbi:unnamed protein product [Closterium sp. NIES-53]